MKREIQDFVCELIPGFFLSENRETGEHVASPSVWYALVKPKQELAGYVKQLPANLKEDIEKNPGFPRYFRCTVTREIHGYEES